MEWYEKYRDASEPEIIAQALDACSRHDCRHCLYQGNGIRCADKLKKDAAKLLINGPASVAQKERLPDPD